MERISNTISYLHGLNITDYSLNLVKKHYPKEKTIVSIDLGINTTAVCSAIKYDGTITDRLFINQAVEKDHMYRLANRVCKIQKFSGKKAKMPNIWRKINNINSQIVNDTINKIIKFAVKNNADVIVFEYLDKIKIKGKRNKRIR